MLGRSCCGKEIKVNVINYLSVTALVNIYLYIGHHFENEHHFELKNIKNEFSDLKNLIKHVLHIEILHKPRYVHYFIFRWQPF